MALKVWDMLSRATLDLLRNPTPQLRAAMEWLQQGVPTLASSRPRAPRRRRVYVRCYVGYPTEHPCPMPGRTGPREGAWKRPGGASRSRRLWQLQRSEEERAVPTNVTRRTSSTPATNPFAPTKSGSNLHAAQERAFARHQRYHRNRIFFQNNGPDVLENIRRGDRVLADKKKPDPLEAARRAVLRKPERPAVVWSESRKRHNFLVHYANGNSASSSSLVSRVPMQVDTCGTTVVPTSQTPPCRSLCAALSSTACRSALSAMTPSS